MYRKRILAGERFGEREVVCELDERKNGYVLYLVKCKCGNTSKLSYSYLKRHPHNLCLNCSCKNSSKKGKDNHFYRHGHANREQGKSGEYNCWISMRSRCNNPNEDQYKDYGGRGISICERWNEFPNFYEDLGPRPKGSQLDRIDNNGNYCKENCRWADILTQANNRRTTTIFIVDGKEIPRTILERKLGISKERFRRRLEAYAIRILKEKNVTYDEMREIFITK